MPKRRLGVALLLPPALALEVDALRRALGDGSLGRIPPHLTLVPPVNVREDRLDGALAVLRRAAASIGDAPLHLELGPVATFAPVTPVAYLAVGGELDRLRALRDAVFVDPLERRLTFDFHPHVTVAEDLPDDRLAAAVAALADYRVTVTVERVHLLEEGRGDRVWRPIADAALGAAAIVGRGGGLELELAVSDGADPEARRLLAGVALTVTARREGRVVGVVHGWGGAIAELVAEDEGVERQLRLAYASEAARRTEL